jgi:hypothetical protein
MAGEDDFEPEQPELREVLADLGLTVDRQDLQLPVEASEEKTKRVTSMNRVLPLGFNLARDFHKLCAFACDKISNSKLGEWANELARAGEGDFEPVLVLLESKIDKRLWDLGLRDH